MIEPTAFTPVSALIGGALIGLAAVLLMLSLGRIAGISGHLRMSFSGSGTNTDSRMFLLGLVAGAAVVYHVIGIWFPDLQFSPRQNFPLWKLIAGGVLVGLGTAMGSGCTSGHGVCGLARFSKRSLAATMVFMALGVFSAVVFRHLLGSG